MRANTGESREVKCRGLDVRAAAGGVYRPLIEARLSKTMASLRDNNETTAPATPAPAGSPGEVLWVALKLGLTSFGGPIAHLGYYERTYVRERRWLNSEQYGGLISLCQLLPGPTSSQVGFLIGLHRAGWMGALAAWTDRVRLVTTVVVPQLHWAWPTGLP